MSHNTIILSDHQQGVIVLDTLRGATSSCFRSICTVTGKMISTTRETFIAGRRNTQSTVDAIPSWSGFPWVEYRDPAHQWDYFRMQI